MKAQPKSREEYLKERERDLERMRKMAMEQEAYWAQQRPKTPEEGHKAFVTIYGRPDAPKFSMLLLHKEQQRQSQNT